MTVGIDYKIKVVCPQKNGVKIKLQLQDTAGNERFRLHIINFY